MVKGFKQLKDYCLKILMNLFKVQNIIKISKRRKYKPSKKRKYKPSKK